MMILLIIILLFSIVTGIGLGIFFRYFNIFYIWSHKPIKDSKQHGGELVAQVLKSHGVKYIFTLIGGHISPILVGAEKIGIKIVDTRHEVSAVFAADAVARLSGSIGVAAVTAGPGVTNTITAVKNAQLAESPILIIGGSAATMLKGRGALQDIDQMSLFQSICKFSITIKYVRDIIPGIKLAIKEALSGTPGPVFVEMPIDILYPYAVVSKEVLGSANKFKSFTGKIISSFLNNYLDNLFAGAWEPRDTTPLIPDIPIISDNEINKCALLLSEAKRPVIIVGSQATLPPTDVNLIRKALERLGIPCYLSGMARGLLGESSPIQFRHQRSAILKKADVIVLAGTVCDFRLQYGRVLPKSAKIIAINRSKEQLKKNQGLFWEPSLSLLGDVGSFLHELSLFLTDFKYPNEWNELLKEVNIEKENLNRKMSTEKYDQLNPVKIMYDLDEILPDNTILVLDGGDFIGTAAYILRARKPLGWLDPGPFGTLGVGGGFALGAKICRPDSQVWIIWGDGSSGFSIAEFDSFKRHKTPVIALIGNDACWTQIAREQFPLLQSDVACNLAYTDYHLVAEGFGAKGIIIKKENEDNLKEVFIKAQQLNEEGHSVCINAVIGKSKFREGSISV